MVAVMATVRTEEAGPGFTREDTQDRLQEGVCDVLQTLWVIPEQIIGIKRSQFHENDLFANEKFAVIKESDFPVNLSTVMSDVVI